MAGAQKNRNEKEKRKEERKKEKRFTCPFILC